jgi:hypothetical protein
VHKLSTVIFLFRTVAVAAVVVIVVVVVVVIIIIIIMSCEVLGVVPIL